MFLLIYPDLLTYSGESVVCPSSKCLPILREVSSNKVVEELVEPFDIAACRSQDDPATR